MTFTEIYNNSKVILTEGAEDVEFMKKMIEKESNRLNPCYFFCQPDNE